MNPEQNTENLNLERQVGPSGSEFVNTTPETQEIQPGGIERGAENKELTSEARAAAIDATATIGGQPVVQPAIPTPSLQGPSVSAINSAPLQAADEDNIEKEWVDKAKNVIDSTKGDPHLKEQRIVGVREEYQKQRFNRTRGDV